MKTLLLFCIIITLCQNYVKILRFGNIQIRQLLDSNDVNVKLKTGKCCDKLRAIQSQKGNVFKCGNVLSR